MPTKYCELTIILFVTVLKFTQPETSESDYCAPGNDGFKECDSKMAICHIQNNSYICKCPEGMQIEEDGKCKDVCSSEGRGYRFCESENALCQNDSNDPRGFRCICPEGMIRVPDSCTDGTEKTTRVSTTLDPTEETRRFSTTLDQTEKTRRLSTTLDPTEKTRTLSTTLDPTEKTRRLSTTLDPTEKTRRLSTTLDGEECSEHCSKNATCVKLKHGFMCLCKTGYVQYEDVPVEKEHCTRNCMQSSCEEICKQMKCLLREEKNKESVAGIDIENKFSGWPISATLTCVVLICLVIMLSSLLACALHRHMKLRKSQILEKNQVIYQRMNQQGVRSESKDTLVTGYI